MCFRIEAALCLSVSVVNTFSKEAPPKPVIMKWFSLWNSSVQPTTPLPRPPWLAQDPFYLKRIRICSSVSQLSVGKMANLRLAGRESHCQRKSSSCRLACSRDQTLQFGFWQTAELCTCWLCWPGRLSVTVVGESNIWCQSCAPHNRLLQGKSIN